ncbi:MAG: CDP-alcohol phosphatidyltransferase family protein [Planctomycetes bacterium]|nr:CDP-alcohol phosphatidyltransferase family protein [Planctomycetota bacterium]
MRISAGRIIYHNLANTVSILGVLPLCLLFLENGVQYLIPLIIYNNIMDDLDGILAAKLHIKSEFGAILDNVCDAFSHTLFVLLVTMEFADLGNGTNRVTLLTMAIVLSGLAAATTLVLRVVSRLSPKSATGTGSATNELVRHLLFVLLLEKIYGFNPAPILIATFALHAVSMLAPIRMPYLIRSLTKSATAISLVNMALAVAWLVPYTTLVIAGCFVISYLYSCGWGCIKRIRQVQPGATE